MPPPSDADSPSGILALPEELLVHVFAGMDLADRHRGLALCCRGWHRLVCSSPMLLRSVSVSIPNTPAFMTRLRSLCQWLLRRAAPHMEQLRLRLSHEAAGAWNDVESQWWRLDFTTTLAAAMAACGMHGRLRDLSLQLDIDFSIHLGSWMAPLASLQRLTVTLADGIVILAGSLRCVSVLQHLSIAAFPYSFSTSTTWQAGSALPASLTSLCLGGEEGARMLPAQAALLTNLQQLVLLPRLETSDEEEDDGPWEQLCSLTCLRMSGFSTRAPRGLGALTQLRSLHLARPSGGDLFSSAEAELLHEALPALQHLTHLGLELVLLSPPASLASLRQLRSFGFLSYEDSDDPEDPGQLPAGPWVAGLQRLAGSCSLLTASLPVLEAASQLQELGLLVVVDSEQQAALRILQWAAGRPALRRVRVECLGRLGSAVRRAVSGAARQLPQLELDVYQFEDPPWLDEYDWQAVFPDLPPVPSCP